MLSNLSSAVDPVNAAILHDRGMPLLEGTETGLAAFRHLFELRDMRARPSLVSPEPAPQQIRDKWRKLLETEQPTEAQGLEMLSDYGVPVVPTRSAGSVAEAVGAAKELGWPVVLKTAEPGVHHKSDVGGVLLGLADEQQVRSAYQDLAERIGHRVVVAPLVAGGVEVALGVVHDGQFGPLVLAAAGGTLIEVLGDRALAFPPLDDVRARALIDRLTIRPLLDGVRGKPAADIGALCKALIRLSVLAVELGDLISALDVNPVIVSGRGCVAVDALVLPRS
jgi:acyl-CoA synthetase (NDP forming)